MTEPIQVDRKPCLLVEFPAPSPGSTTTMRSPARRRGSAMHIFGETHNRNQNCCHNGAFTTRSGLGWVNHCDLQEKNRSPATGQRSVRREIAIDGCTRRNAILRDAVGKSCHARGIGSTRINQVSLLQYWLWQTSDRNPWRSTGGYRED